MKTLVLILNTLLLILQISNSLGGETERPAKFYEGEQHANCQ